MPMRDADVVPDSNLDNLERLSKALVSIAIRRTLVPPATMLVSLDIVGVETIYGKVDVLLERREDYPELAAAASFVPVEDVTVAVGA